MRSRPHALKVALAGAIAFGSAAEAQLPASALAVERGGRWNEWWQSGSAPTRWPGRLPLMDSVLAWRPASPGIRLAELRLAGTGEAWRVRAIVVHVDPRQFELRPVFGGMDSLGAGNWRIGQAGDAALALNAGQFSGRRPWGWIVRDGRELQPPGRGPLSSALLVADDGAKLVHADGIPELRARGGFRHAFQSYPTLLRDGVIPAPLRARGLGVDVNHRDGRLGIGTLRDSTLLIVLTRFEALNGALDLLPFGLTTPEMAALMGALGARDAMLLDGGISGQLMVRFGTDPKRWPGLRGVPMGLVFR